MTLLAYVSKEDGTLAYVAAGAVLWIEPIAPEKCVIHLARGDWMNCYESADAVARRLDPSVARPGSRVECTCHESARPSSRWRWGECPDCGDRGECSTCKQFDEQMRRAFELSTLPSRESESRPLADLDPAELDIIP